MQRQMMRAKVHRATVTDADLEYEGSLAMDSALMEAADLYPNEVIQVWNITNGNRFNTYVIPAPHDSGMICINGAAAHQAQPGDKVIIAAYAWMDESEARQYQPRVVFVDEHNRVRHSRAFEVVAGGTGLR